MGGLEGVLVLAEGLRSKVGTINIILLLVTTQFLLIESSQANSPKPILTLASYILYNAYLHPLRHYPGPFWSRTTNFPRELALFSGRAHLYAADLHAKYGEVVRVAPNELSYSNAGAWKEIYAHKPQFPRDPYFIPDPPGGFPGMVSSNNETNARMRKTLVHAFSEKALREQEPLSMCCCSLVVCCFVLREREREGLQGIR